VETLTVADARRLALARAGLVPSPRKGRPGRAAAHAVIERFGYLQLDTISVAGARSHALVLLARLEGMDPALGESLLVPGAPLFEYWGHAASWIPLDLWPHFAFRRRGFVRSPRWRGVLRRHRAVAERLLRRCREEGPFRSTDLEGRAGPGGWWRLRPSRIVADALWGTGELVVRERRGFQRIWDLPERVLPAEVLRREIPEEEAMRSLVLRAFEGHGWAEERTVRNTWYFRGKDPSYRAALRSLEEDGSIVRCALETGEKGWARPEDLALAARLRRRRPEEGRGVLLSPFDPLLWDRARVRRLFGFDVRLEIYVPPARRKYGYYCMPILAGERLVGRADLKAEREEGRLRVRALHLESRRPPAADRKAADAAIRRLAAALGLDPVRA